MCLASDQAWSQNYTVLHRFDGTDGMYPSASLVSSGPTLYGTASSGGLSNVGTLFRLNSDGSGFTVLKHFTGSEGATPEGLVLLGPTLYGLTAGGGNSNQGTIFKMNTDGTGHLVLKHFTGSDGANPYGGPLLSDTTLYGTTYWGGNSDNGVVFKLNTDGSGYTVLKYFMGSEGSHPGSDLVLSGTTLYGTANHNTRNGNGIVFSINTDGSGFTVLKELTNTVNSPNQISAPLALSGATLYGTAHDSGYSKTVFKLNSDGSGFSVLQTISALNDWMPPGINGLLLSGSTLFGTTCGVDPHESGPNFGTLFQLNTDGSGYTVLHGFDYTNGASPQTVLTLAGNALYGTTTYGGSNKFGVGNGVVFSLSLAPPTILTGPQSQTAETGTAVSFWVEASSPLPLFYLWYLTDTNLISYSTNCDLELTNVQFAQSGAYTAVITNAAGAITSSPAMLNVIPSVVRRPVPSLVLRGATGSTLNLDYADALGPGTYWLTLDTVTLAGTSQWCFDITAPLPPERYYRAWQTGAPSIRPSVSLPGMVPAITLTGNIGGSVRLDYINQFGPTDAWVTLATVTLTNTSQLYFDTSSRGQPQRLYRLVPTP